MLQRSGQRCLPMDGAQAVQLYCAGLPGKHVQSDHVTQCQLDSATHWRTSAEASFPLWSHMFIISGHSHFIPTPAAPQQQPQQDTASMRPRSSLIANEPQCVLHWYMPPLHSCSTAASPPVTQADNPASSPQTPFVFNSSCFACRLPAHRTVGLHPCSRIPNLLNFSQILTPS